MFGKKAVELLKELKHSQWISPYNDEYVRKIIEEMNELFAQIVAVADDPSFDADNPSIAANLFFHHQCFLRNRRCVLAYLYERCKRLKQLRWQTGIAIPEHMKQNLNYLEEQFFEEYDSLLSEYNKDMDVDVLSQVQPPKDVYIEVRALQDLEKIIAPSGIELHFQKNQAFFIRRSDAEHLIQKHIVEHISS